MKLIKELGKVLAIPALVTVLVGVLGAAIAVSFGAGKEVFIAIVAGAVVAGMMTIAMQDAREDPDC